MKRWAQGWISGAALTLLLLLASSAAALPPKTWVIAIGNNEGDADEISLLYAERDARSVAEVLGRHGGVKARRTSVLVDELAPAVRASIMATNAQIRAEIGTGENNTALVVFYSGHADASALHMDGSHLPLEELRDLVSGSAAAPRRRYARPPLRALLRPAAATQRAAGVPGRAEGRRRGRAGVPALPLRPLRPAGASPGLR